jgi:LacI family transcriptional regulator
LPRARRSRDGKPPGLRDIAERLGVSIGTVDRALHDRPEISARTRARVLDAARELGYRPNLAARSLSSEKRLRIAVNFPRELASFWDLAREGLLEAARPFEASGVEVVYRSYPGLGNGEREALQQALDDPRGVDGIIMVPGLPERLPDLVRRATERGIPVVYVNTDAPGTQRLTVIWADPLTNGALVGELMGRFLRGRGRILPVTGHLGTVEHARKLEGFRGAIAALWPEIEVAEVVEGHEDARETHEKCRSRLAHDRDVAGVYVSTVNTPPVVRALRDEGLAGRVTVVATDLYPALAPMIESGVVAATIDQRPWVQGQMAFQTLYRYLAQGEAPAEAVGLSPHVVMRSNLQLLLARLRSASESWPEVPQPTMPLPSTTRR